MTFVVLIPYYGVDTWRTSVPWSGLIWKSRIVWGLFIFTSCSALLQSFSFHFNIVLLLFLRVYGKRKWQIKRIQSVHLNTTLPQILLCVYVYRIRWYELNWTRLYNLNLWIELIWFECYLAVSKRDCKRVRAMFRRKSNGIFSRVRLN